MNLQNRIHLAFPPLTDARLYEDGRRAGLDGDERNAPDSPDWREGYRRGRYLAATCLHARMDGVTVLVQDVGDGTVQVYRTDGSAIGYPRSV